jgi:hypothetical protein
MQKGDNGDQGHRDWDRLLDDAKEAAAESADAFSLLIRFSRLPTSTLDDAITNSCDEHKGRAT